jgi:hypothetical protein
VDVEEVLDDDSLLALELLVADQAGPVLCHRFSIPVPSNIYIFLCCGSGAGSGSACFWASWILLLSNKNSKKNLNSYSFVTSLWLFIFEK